jgi:hypothetical protein
MAFAPFLCPPAPCRARPADQSMNPLRQQEKGIFTMIDQAMILWTYLRARVAASGGLDERGTVVETVILTAIFAALAIAVGVIIVTKVTSKANSINLG